MLWKLKLYSIALDGQESLVHRSNLLGLILRGTFNSFNFAVGIMEFALDFFVVLVDFCESC